MPGVTYNSSYSFFAGLSPTFSACLLQDYKNLIVLPPIFGVQWPLILNIRAAWCYWFTSPELPLTATPPKWKCSILQIGKVGCTHRGMMNEPGSMGNAIRGFLSPKITTLVLKWGQWSRMINHLLLSSTAIRASEFRLPHTFCVKWGQNNTILSLNAWNIMARFSAFLMLIWLTHGAMED